MPPALVDRLPPIWQLPSAPRLNGNSRSASAAACCRSARMQPASTVIVKLTGSIARIRFMRPSARTTLCLSSGGTPPPTRPVLPPCGTIGKFRFGANPHHRGHLRGRSRADDQPGGTPVEATRLDEIGLLVARIGDPTARTDRCLDPLDGL